MYIYRDRDRPREGFERVRARLGDGSPNRWTARWMHTQKKIRLACPRVSSPISRESARRAYLGRVQEGRFVRALDRLRALRGFQGDGVSREDGAAGDLGAGGATRGDADRRADRGGGGDGESGQIRVSLGVRSFERDRSDETRGRGRAGGWELGFEYIKYMWYSTRHTSACVYINVLCIRSCETIVSCRCVESR